MCSALQPRERQDWHSDLLFYALHRVLPISQRRHGFLLEEEIREVGLRRDPAMPDKIHLIFQSNTEKKQNAARSAHSQKNRTHRWAPPTRSIFQATRCLAQRLFH